MSTTDAQRECPRCGAALPDALAWCSACRTLSSPSGSLAGVDMGGAQLSGVVVRGASLHRSKIDMVYAAVLAGYRGTPAWLTSGQSMVGATGERFVTALGAPLRCPLCGGENFSARDVTLGSRGLALFDLEWLGTGACALSCTVCTHIMWFARAPGRA